MTVLSYQTPAPRARSPWWLASVIAMAVAIAAISQLHRPADRGQLEFAARQMRTGHWPLWDDRSGWGQPLLAKGNLAALSPTVLPLLLLRGSQAWFLREAVRLLLAGFGITILIRRWGVEPWRLMLLAGAYLLVMASVGQFWDSAEEAMVWLPWLCLSLAFLARSVTPARTVLAALAFAAVLLSGNLQASLACLILAAVYLLLQARWLALPAAIVAATIGAGLAGVVRVPRWERPQVSRPPVAMTTAATFVRNYKLLPTAAQAKQMVADPFDPMTTVVLDEQVSPDWMEAMKRLKANPPSTKPSGFGFFNRAKKGPVPIDVAEGPGHWRIPLPDDDGWLIVRETYDEDWSARVVKQSRFGRSSTDVATLRGDGGLIAIPTYGQGVGYVTLDYRPKAWRRGVIVSAASLMLCLVILGSGSLPKQRLEPYR